MKEDETKQLDIDMTAILRQLSVLEKELKMVEEEIANLEKDVSSGDISSNAADKIRGKFSAERESLRAAVRKVLEQSIQTSKNIQKTLETKLKEY
jgi:predicted  nucleic acid-binding Zn-ribbon protein